MQRGYYYPWKSKVGPNNGKDAYVEMLRSHLSPDADVLEIGCGHGELTLDIAPLCKTVLAYDRVASLIDIARREASRRGVENVEFVCADSSVGANGGTPRIPADAGAFDLLVSRRGPLHWIGDARRVARPGAVMLQLNPDLTAPPLWDDGYLSLFATRIS